MVVMREVIDDITRWLIEGQGDIALATVLTTWGSAPRKAGAKMAFTAGGAAISGSVSGGCVEGAVIEAGSEVLAGTIEVFAERLDVAAYEAARRWIEAGTSGALLTAVAGPDEWLGRKAIVERGQPVAGPLAPALDGDTLALAETARHARRVATAGGVEVFIDPIRPAPSLVMVGGAHIAVALARLARVVGYRTVVIDPRRAFGSAARFPDVDRLVQAWPDKALADNPLTAESAVVTLSHDPKIDDPALRAALSSDAFYIGALGSRQTHAARRERLAALGFDETQLARIHAPIGLDIGAQTPEEIAVAILGQVISVQYSVGQ